MEPDFWHTRWNEQRIGFHQTKPNPRLERRWSEIVDDTGAAVLVPLCGKSLDMLWLAERGHHVIGVELSEIAARAFFNENDLDVVQEPVDDFQRYRSTAADRAIEIWVGDFFALDPKHCESVAAFYDRASLIALPEAMRGDYVRQLARLLPLESIGLVLTIDYDPSRMQGPPFPVPAHEVRSLFANDFALHELERASGPDRLGNLRGRGLDTLEECVFRVERRVAV